MEKSYKATHAQGTASLGQGVGPWPADTSRARSFLSEGGQGAAITGDIIRMARLSLPTLAIEKIRV